MTELSGDWDAFAKKLRKLANVDFYKLHEQAGEAMVANTQLRFKSGKGPDGRAWKGSMKLEGKTLVDTARLRSSVTKRVSVNQTEVGTNVRYARIHQYGGTIRVKKAKYLRFNVGGRWVRKKSVKIPARPFIGISEDDKKDIQDILRNTVEEALK